VGVDPNPLSCTIIGLTNGTQYSIGVTASNSAGSSDSSAGKSVPVQLLATVPWTDTGVDLSAGQQVTIDVPGSVLYGPTTNFT
jgi:hypothetical protein